MEGRAKVRVGAASYPYPCPATFLTPRWPVTLSWAGESRLSEKRDKEDLRSREDSHTVALRHEWEPPVSCRGPLQHEVHGCTSTVAPAAQWELWTLS